MPGPQAQAALRHTFLTEAGEHTDPFTLQYVAGHDNIETTMRYVHPRAEAVERQFECLADLGAPGKAWGGHKNRHTDLSLRRTDRSLSLLI
jgi:hypothetical protein